MLTYESLKDKPQLFLDLTSLTPTEFEAILPAFEKAWAASETKQESQRKQPRQRKKGGGRKGQIKALADKLLFILVYFKVYPLQVVQGQLFGMSQGQANVWIHTLTPVLQVALGYEQQLPGRDPAQMETVLAQCETLTFQIDGSERRRQRPKASEMQETYYSGKKKAHTVKNIAVANPETRRVVCLGPTVPGKTHDKRASDQAELNFPEMARLEKDTGFQGYEPEGVLTFQPQKSRGENRMMPPRNSSIRYSPVCGLSSNIFFQGSSAAGSSRMFFAILKTDLKT